LRARSRLRALAARATRRVCLALGLGGRLGRLGWVIFWLLYGTLALLLLLLVFLALLRVLADVVHEFFDGLIIHLLVRAVELLALSLVLFVLAPFVAAPFRCVAPLALRDPTEVVHCAVPRVAPTHALVALRLPLVILELGAVVVRVLASLCCAALGTLSPLRLAHLILLLLLPLQLLLLLHEICACIFVQVIVKGLTPVEVVVGLGNRVFVALDLLDLVQVLFQGLACMLGPFPAGCLSDDGLNSFVLDHRVNVNGVVHPAEDAALVDVPHVHEVQQLEPQRLQLVCIVFEEVEVVAHS